MMAAGVTFYRVFSLTQEHDRVGTDSKEAAAAVTAKELSAAAKQAELATIEGDRQDKAERQYRMTDKTKDEVKDQTQRFD